MLYSPLGQTGLTVSKLGLGTVKWGRNQGVKYPQPFELPNDAALQSLLACARECGINLLDTAPAYGQSEERLGRLLKGQREQWVLVSKAGESFSDGQSQFDFSPQAILRSVEQSLQRLQTDYLDVLLIHSDGQDLQHIEEDQVFVTLGALKQAGLIRAFGMSTKTLAGGLATVEQADVVMVTYNPEHTEEHAVLDRALALQKGVLVKKALNSGHLAVAPGQDPTAAALRFVLAHSGVSSVIVGTINEAHLRKNADALGNGLS